MDLGVCGPVDGGDCTVGLELFPLGGEYDWAMDKYGDVARRMEGRMAGYPEDMAVLVQAIAWAGPGDYLEIGSYFGGSAIMAGLAKKFGVSPGEVICIDPYDEGYPWRYDHVTNGVANKETFWKNMELFDLSPTLFAVSSLLFDWEKIREERNVVVCYVDGDHTAPYVQNDLWACVGLRPRYIVVDDYSRDHPQVRREVMKVAHQTDYELVRISGKTAVLKDGLWKD